MTGMAATAERATTAAAALSAPWGVPVSRDTGEPTRDPQRRQSVPPAGTAGAVKRPAARRCEGKCGRPVARDSRTGLCRECRTAASARVQCTGSRPELVTEANESGRCQARVAPSNKTGQCRACWRYSLAKDGHKTDPQEQAAMLARMAASFARRCEGEDPGLGLAALMELAERVGDLAETVGMKLCAAQGTSAVAADLGWDRRRADKRWGPEARARKDGWQS